MKIDVIYHSSIIIDDIAIDPYGLPMNFKFTAKYILISHPHYDHLSIEDIRKICDDDTIFVASKDAENTLLTNFPKNKIYTVLPYEKINFNSFLLETIPAYNINKNFHKKEFNWLGFKIIKNRESFAYLGDTDINDDNKKIKCDTLFVPIGGTYTTTAKEAALLTNIISPKNVIPVHYNSIVGSKTDEKAFIQNLNKNINVEIFL